MSPGSSGLGHPGGSRARRAARGPRAQCPEPPPRAGTRAPALGAGLSEDSALEVPLWQGCARPRVRGFSAGSPVRSAPPPEWVDTARFSGEISKSREEPPLLPVSRPSQDTLRPTLTSFAPEGSTGHRGQLHFRRLPLWERALEKCFPHSTKWGRWAVRMPEGGRRSPTHGEYLYKKKARKTRAKLQSTDLLKSL